MNLGKIQTPGSLITTPKLLVCFLFFLTYWTIKSPVLGTTELDDLKWLLAVKPLGLQNITNIMLALRLLVAMRT